MKIWTTSSFLSRNWVEGAIQKVNGKWTNPDMFPGREFDDLDEFRAAKKQRAARRKEYSAQARPWSTARKEAEEPELGHGLDQDA